MANPFTQYLKDTRGELNHVAWPTQKQTLVYTILVAAISIGVAIYLGAFDFVFTSALSDILGSQGASSQLQVPTSSTSSSAQAPSFTIPGATSTK